ncbi:MAG: peptidase M22 [Clostridia bacterium]|nr:peptidase M22 [Clostridia bacterium]
MIVLGIDTSNYTTSAALYDSVAGVLYQKRRLLKVKSGELGLRQADAVFQHTIALPAIIDELYSETKLKPDVIAVSVKPDETENSYMPCFMTGKCVADSMGKVFSVPVKYFSHQAGHIAAALYSAGRLEMLENEFLAFHVSGGTTQAVKCSPDSEKIIKIEQLSSSLDLKAGQVIDRVGKLLGIPFPAGAALDKVSRESSREYKIKPFMRDGCCSLSGLENKCEKMYKDGESKADIAKYCIDFVSAALREMTLALLEKNPSLPVVYSGGVMSNSLIKEKFTREFNAVFAENGFSSDNAAGIAVLGER